jgi:hypothetical protein
MGKRVRFAADPAFGLMADFARRQRESPASSVGTLAESAAAEEPVRNDAPAELSAPAEGGGVPAHAATNNEARKRVLAAVVVAVAIAAGVWWWRSRAAAGEEAGLATEAMAAEGELARYEAESREYEAARERLLAEHRALAEDRARVIDAIKQLRALSEHNNDEFRKRYAPKKETFDSDIASMEDEQNLETAFALKNELDDKKKGLLQLNSQLGEQHKAAMQRLQTIEREINDVKKVYNNSFDDKIN